MADRLTPEQRSENMRRVRSKDTVPELKVRRMLHGMGYRYGLHRSDLPGTPDIVLTKFKAVIFVNGCYWHRHKHKGCRRGKYMPKTNFDFYKKKFRDNVARDRRNQEKLLDMNWRVFVIWECEAHDRVRLKNMLESAMLELTNA